MVVIRSRPHLYLHNYHLVPSLVKNTTQPGERKERRHKSSPSDCQPSEQEDNYWGQIIPLTPHTRLSLNAERGEIINFVKILSLLTLQPAPCTGLTDPQPRPCQYCIYHRLDLNCGAIFFSLEQILPWLTGTSVLNILRS